LIDPTTTGETEPIRAPASADTAGIHMLISDAAIVGGPAKLGFKIKVLVLEIGELGTEVE
jgi:hypothetical protein